MRTVFITGASRGIGRACALLFAENGYRIAANYLQDDEAALSLKAEIEKNGGTCSLYKADISDSASAAEIIKQAETDLGGLDVLINNAGISQQKLFDTITDSDFDRMLSVNTKGTFNCSREASRIMIRCHSGRIINISSMWGVTGGSMEVHYSASKAAVIGMTKALAKELGPSGITVNCIAPGLIDTDMNSCHSPETIKEIVESTPMMRIGTPRDVALAALFFAGEDASFITGQVLGVDGGLV